mgnify:CR=1 FL=1
MKTAKDIMSPIIFATDPNLSILDAAREMAIRNIGSLLIVEKGKAVGIVTERDILKALGEGMDLSQPISKIMSKDLITAAPDDPLTTVKEKMIKANVRHLPVVDENGFPLGIISIRDVLANL